MGLPAAYFAEQAENFQIEPDQRDHQAKCSVPFHILGRAAVNACFDHVEIEDEVQGCDDDDEEAEENSHSPPA